MATSPLSSLQCFDHIPVHFREPLDSILINGDISPHSSRGHRDAKQVRKPAMRDVLLGLAVVARLAAFFNPPDWGVTSGEFEYVQRVVDGDTLLLGTGERVRLIGVDAPETNHPDKPVEYFTKEASAFTRRMAEGKRIKLDYDDVNKHIDHKDRYGRTLAYVFLEDGTLLNAEIIRQGYGHALTRYPFSRLEEFRRLEHEARGQRRGLWRTPVGN